MKGKPAPKKVKTSARRVVATIFNDSCGIVFVDRLDKGKIIIGAYYALLLYKLKIVIKSAKEESAVYFVRQRTCHTP